MTDDPLSTVPDPFSSAERELLNKTLRFAAERAWKVNASEFFADLVKFLGETLEVAYAFCDTIDPNDDTVVQTLAMYAHGEITENISYSLKGTPCENVIGRMTCCYTEKVQQSFPRDELLSNLNAESYAGVPLWSADDTPLGLIAVIDDKPLKSPGLVTTLIQILSIRAASELERMQVLEQLQSNQKRFSDFAESASDWFWETDDKNRFTYISERFFEITGIERTNLIGKASLELMVAHQTTENREHWNRHYRYLDSHRPFKAFEHAISSPDGEQRFIRTSGVPVYATDGEFVGYRGTGTDVSQSNKAEREILKLSQAVEQSATQVVITDAGGHIESVNPRFTQVTGYEIEEVTGKTMRILKSSHTLPEVHKELWKTISSGNVWQGVLQNKRKDGSIYWNSTSISPIKTPGGVITHYLAIQEDITERKQAEDQIKASLEEKEILIDEIHHRVKNNLQVIVSMLDMQQRRAQSKDIKEALLDSKNRIRVMAQVYQNLYESSEREGINLKQYLDMISNDLASVNGADHRHITVSFEADEVNSKINNAIPCCHILSELLSNSFKYAFPDNRPGKISITLKKLEDDCWQLDVADDGIGMPNGVDLQNSTGLGLTLVQTYVRGRGWELSENADHGTHYILKANG